jgi:hypothetical protein
MAVEETEGRRKDSGPQKRQKAVKVQRPSSEQRAIERIEGRRENRRL